MSRRYFGTDGIRGLANKVITPELALKVGQAAGLMFQNGDHRHRVVIGKDTRLSGYMIESALVAGFTSVGMDVLLLGPMPTPAVAMLTRSMRADLGVMISASHNPFDDNGIKLFGPDGFKLSDEVERADRGPDRFDMSQKLAEAADFGRARRIDDVRARYVEFAKRTLPRDMPRRPARRDRLRQWRRLQGRARRPVGTGRGSLLDRRRARRHQHQRRGRLDAPEALSRKVRELRADIGIALDGDADRVVIFDENGQLVDGDQIMARHRRSAGRRRATVAAAAWSPR